MGVFNFLKREPKVASTELILVPKVFDEVFEVRDPKYEKYTVKFFPYSGFYICTYQGERLWYLKQSYLTGVVEFTCNSVYADYKKSEHEAWLLIDLHIEQRIADTVRTIKR